MEPTLTPTPNSNISKQVMFEESNTKTTFSFPNGAPKKQPPHRAALPTPEDLLYRECLRNHAATLGGHALDGCGEFMPSPAANPADPTSLLCAACACHRNFHRRLPDHHHHLPFNPRRRGEADNKEDNDDDDDDEEDDDGEKEINHHHQQQQQHNRSSSISPPPPPAAAAYPSSAPHMLLALSSGLSGGLGTPASLPNQERMVTLQQQQQSRKRFRTKFSAEQKEKMQKLSERVGWRMQKRDEELVEEWCREIGVTKGVFKVWMHNNKHHFLAGRGAAGTGIQGNGNGNGHVINASSSSS